MQIIHGILHFGYFRYFCNYEILISIITRDISRESYIFVDIAVKNCFIYEILWKLYMEYYTLAILDIFAIMKFWFQLLLEMLVENLIFL